MSEESIPGVWLQTETIIENLCSNCIEFGYNYVWNARCSACNHYEGDAQCDGSNGCTKCNVIE